MQDKSWTFTDKSHWGSGPWQTEPDKVQWTDAATGLPCLVVRGQSGSLCGYVGVTEDHPWFGVPDFEVEADTHGGLTYADVCSGEEHGICHVVEPGEPDRVWWLGFDCAHAGDLAPRMSAETAQSMEAIHALRLGRKDHYWTLAEVQAECTALAAQVAAAKETGK